jgi:hypothetical protein
MTDLTRVAIPGWTGRLALSTAEERQARREENDRELLLLGKVLETYEIRFTKDGKILTLDPMEDERIYKVMNRNHLKMLLKEKYKRNGFKKKGKELERLIEFFLEACAEWCVAAKEMGEIGEFVQVADQKIQ